MKKTPVFKTNLAVTIADINYGGHLDHTKLIQMLHEARLQYLTSINLSEKINDSEILVVKGLQVDYKNEAGWSDIIEIALTISLKKAALMFDYTVCNKTRGNLTANATVMLVPINMNTKKIVRKSSVHQKLMSYFTY